VRCIHDLVAALVKAEQAVVLVSSVAIVSSMAVVVFARYAPFRIAFGVGDICTLSGAWLYFVGVGLVTYEKVHISCGILHLVIKDVRKQRSIEIAILILAVATSIYFCVEAFAYCRWIYGAHIVSRALRIPLIYSTAALFVGGVLMTMHFSIHLKEELVRAILTREKASREEM